ncbi:MAG: acylphosphatase [Alphaproteobacteria bacterium]|nr:acylphosphatase [Alphaproteobacteria bacterium]
MADEPSVMALHLRIRGRVQGIFFRRWVMEEATRRGIRGWVRNRADGSVEAVLAGEMGAVRAMVEACRQGPSGAQVAGSSSIRANSLPPTMISAKPSGCCPTFRATARPGDGPT